MSTSAMVDWCLDVVVVVDGWVWSGGGCGPCTLEGLGTVDPTRRRTCQVVFILFRDFFS